MMMLVFNGGSCRPHRQRQHGLLRLAPIECKSVVRKDVAISSQEAEIGFIWTMAKRCQRRTVVGNDRISTNREYVHLCRRRRTGCWVRHG